MLTPAVTVVDVSLWEPLDEDEQMGARRKLWLCGGDPIQTWLWKEGREPDRLPEAGADLWAEMIAAAVAHLVPLPAAEVCLATRDGVRGIISRRLAADLVHGNELLSGNDPSYEVSRTGQVPGYDLPAIRRALEGYEGSEPGMRAYESFVGLLVLDGLISNTDRHHENWAVVQSTGRLAPSFDHGASLGFNVPVAKRHDVLAVARRGRARHFPGGPTPVALAQAALDGLSPELRELWMSRVRNLDLGTIEDLVRSLPDHWMSEGARTFVVTLLNTNRRRLLT